MSESISKGFVLLLGVYLLIKSMSGAPFYFCRMTLVSIALKMLSPSLSLDSEMLACQQTSYHP